MIFQIHIFFFDKINTIFVTARNMVDDIVAGTVEMTCAVSSQCPEINSIEPEDEQNERVRQCATGLNKRDDLNMCTLSRVFSIEAR